MLEDHIGVGLLRLRLARQPRLLCHEPRQRYLYLHVVFVLENLTYVYSCGVTVSELPFVCLYFKNNSYLAVILDFTWLGPRLYLPMVPD
jgi:hypothetical protein